VKNIAVKLPNVKEDEKQKLSQSDDQIKFLFDTPFQPGQKNWIDIAVNFLYNILKFTTFYVIKIKKTGKKYRIPRAKRGNIGHAYREQKRLEQIQWAIDKSVKTKGIDHGHLETNTLFLTLTHPYNPTDLKSIENSWRYMQKDVPKFVKTFKNKKAVKLFGNLFGYVGCPEAHELGGCHFHLALIFDKPILCTKMYSEIEKKDVWRVSDEARAFIGEKWSWNFDIRGSDTAAIAGYLTKELGKANHVEGAVRRWLERRKTSKLPVTDEEKGQYINDVKKIWAYFFAIKNGIRLLHVSKSIPRLDRIHHKSQDKEEQEEKTDKKEDEEVETLIINPVAAASCPEFLPFGGEIKVGDSDFFITDKWFEGIDLPVGMVKFKGTIGDLQKKKKKSIEDTS
jgi:hypothetical protein